MVLLNKCWTNILMIEISIFKIHDFFLLKYALIEKKRKNYSVIFILLYWKVIANPLVSQKIFIFIQ